MTDEPRGGTRPREAGSELIRVGTAGWTIPREFAASFPVEGTGLQRYAAVFDSVEINSTFHRPHRDDTFRRWADAVPDFFRFAVKLPKTITHERQLVDCGDLLRRFVDGVRLLGAKLGPLLVQLPPSYIFDPAVADAFFGELRLGFSGPVACEPRHPSWFSAEAGLLLTDFRVARVAADPARVPEAAFPGGWDGLVYLRLHGSPNMYRSAYEPDVIAATAARLTTSAAPERWCMFDNTTLGQATGNALVLRDLCQGGRP